MRADLAKADGLWDQSKQGEAVQIYAVLISESLLNLDAYEKTPWSLPSMKFTSMLYSSAGEELGFILILLCRATANVDRNIGNPALCRQTNSPLRSRKASKNIAVGK